jgi:hypothetical protein
VNTKYFGAAKKSAQNFYSNFGGAYSNVVPQYSYADASMGAGQATSEPFNFIIANSTSVDIANVTLLDSFNNLSASNFGNDVAITITMDNGDTTYTGFLQSLGTQPFNIGEFYINSSNSSQVSKALTVKWRDNSGTTMTKLYYPKIDPTQFVTTVLIVRPKELIPVDGYTSISFTLLGSATLNLALYPAQIIDNARPLIGRAAEQAFSPANLSQANMVKRLG